MYLFSSSTFLLSFKNIFSEQTHRRNPKKKYLCLDVGSPFCMQKYNVLFAMASPSSKAEGIYGAWLQLEIISFS